MRTRTVALLIGTLAMSAGCVAQTAFLSLNTAPQNHCEKAGQGGIWTLNNTQSGSVSVTLLRFVAGETQPQTIVRILTAGETADLGCAQGKPVVTYQIAGQQQLRAP
jgi:hypothetical protein